MVMTAKAEAVEREHGGKPLREILLDHYLELGSWAAVAQRVDVSRNTLGFWRSLHGLTETEVLVAVRARDRDRAAKEEEK